MQTSQLHQRLAALKTRDITILRLNDGSAVMGRLESYTIGGSKLLLAGPRSVLMQPSADGRVGIGLAPYHLPGTFEFTKDESIELDCDTTVRHVATPVAGLEQEYVRTTSGIALARG